MIREYIPSENIEDFNALLNPCLKMMNHPKILPWISRTLLPYDEIALTQWFQASRETQMLFFSEVDESDRLQGIIALKPDRISGFEIITCFVHPKDQGKGIGRTLVQLAGQIAKQQGFHAIAADVFCINKRMIKLMIDEDYLPVQIKQRVRADGGDACRLLKGLT